MPKKGSDETPRWLYRFDNYKRAFALLSEAIGLAETRELSRLEQEGVVQRFEYTWELAWNLLADLLEADGIALDTRTPRVVVRSAYAATLIGDGDVWMEALEARNRMAHTYDAADFKKVVEEIRAKYLNLFADLHKTAIARKVAP